MFGTISRSSYSYIIKVDGYRKMMLMYYTKRNAIKCYRELHNLKYKHITWIEI